MPSQSQVSAERHEGWRKRHRARLRIEKRHANADRQESDHNLGLRPPDIGIEPTTHLGDRYANLVHIGRRQLVLAISERTFLPVVITAAPANPLVARLRVELAEVLRAMSIEGTTIDEELAEMANVTVARTAIRQLTAAGDLGEHHRAGFLRPIVTSTGPRALTCTVAS